jgi:excinuclease ABC subunit B
VEQIIRPTGLLDPLIDVRPVRGQIDDLMAEIKDRTAKRERVLVTTLTKRMAEDLTDHLLDEGVRVNYMHSDTATLERVDIIRELREGKIDVLVGINLLREGLDIPEVSLVAILDADKEGFLRNRRSLIQTMGRAARNVSGKVIMYADEVTDSMREAIDETRRRRALQEQFNLEHGIEPRTVRKAISDISSFIQEATATLDGKDREGMHGEFVTPTTAEEVASELAALPRDEVMRIIAELEEEMAAAAQTMDFERAAKARDQLVELKGLVEGKSSEDVMRSLKKNARKGSEYARRRPYRRKKY